MPVMTSYRPDVPLINPGGICMNMPTSKSLTSPHGVIEIWMSGMCKNDVTPSTVAMVAHEVTVTTMRLSVSMNLQTGNERANIL